MSQSPVAVVLEGEKIAEKVSSPVTHHSYSDAFCLYYDAQTKNVKALNGSGRSPKKLSIDYMRQRGVTGNKIPYPDLNSVTVPGMFTVGN
jgi:gamma-glutamyltranspeptidase